MKAGMKADCSVADLVEMKVATTAARSDVHLDDSLVVVSAATMAVNLAANLAK